MYAHASKSDNVIQHSYKSCFQQTQWHLERRQHFQIELSEILPGKIKYKYFCLKKLISDGGDDHRKKSLKEADFGSKGA